MFKPWQYWLLFIIATVLLSEFLRTFKAFTLLPTWGTVLPLLLVTLGLLLVIIGLLFHHYVQEKNENRLANHVALFDWLLQKIPPHNRLP